MSILPVSPSLHPSKADLWQSRRVRCKLCGYYSILYYIYLFIYLFIYFMEWLIKPRHKTKYEGNYNFHLVIND